MSDDITNSIEQSIVDVTVKVGGSLIGTMNGKTKVKIADARRSLDEDPHNPNVYFTDAEGKKRTAVRHEVAKIVAEADSKAYRAQQAQKEADAEAKKKDLAARGLVEQKDASGVTKIVTAVETKERTDGLVETVDNKTGVVTVGPKKKEGGALNKKITPHFVAKSSNRPSVRPGTAKAPKAPVVDDSHDHEDSISTGGVEPLNVADFNGEDSFSQLVRLILKKLDQMDKQIAAMRVEQTEASPRTALYVTSKPDAPTLN